MNRIILFGPPVNTNIKNGYGGGTGGYTRNMSVYLNEFKFDDFKIFPVFHTINGQFNLGVFTFPIRFIIDIFRIIDSIFRYKPDGIHCMAQYRRALPREFIFSLIAKIIRIPFLYEIKAGAFEDSYSNGNRIYKSMINFVVKNSKVILCEGKSNITFLSRKFQKKAYYFPNIIKDTELVESPVMKLTSAIIHILFVGYCYKDKGVFELVEACKILSHENIKIHLTFIGAEHIDFTNYIEKQHSSPSFRISRIGKLPHDEVLKYFEQNDIYCYPTMHKGEGHNNTINEAMMMSMVIITTKKGFLNQILDDSSAYFLDEVSAESIAEAISLIDNDRKTAIKKAKKANSILKNNFLSSHAKKKIHLYYKELVNL